MHVDVSRDRPTVEQPVDLYAPKLNGPGGFATVHLRVRCCEQGRGSTLGRARSAPGLAVRPTDEAFRLPRLVINSFHCSIFPGQDEDMSGKGEGMGDLILMQKFTWSIPRFDLTLYRW